MRISYVVVSALVVSLVAALAVVAAAWNAEKEYSSSAVSRLSAEIERERAAGAINTNADPAYERLALESPGADWKAVDAYSFIASYPPRLGAVGPGSTPGTIDVPGFLYLESSGNTCLRVLEKATGRKDSLLGSSMLHYYESVDLGSDGVQTVAVGSKQGCIANFDSSQSVYFSYPASQEKDALTAIGSLRMVVSPWVSGTSKL